MFDSKKLAEKLKEMSTLNQATKDVEAFGLKLTLKLLSSEDDMEVFDGLTGIEGVNYFVTLKREVVARAIFKINDEELPDEIEGADGVKMQRRLYIKQTILKNCPQLTLDQLHAAYLVMNIEFKTKLDGSIKYDNADLINKFLDEETAAQVTSKVVDTIIENEANELKEPEEQPTPQPAPHQAQSPPNPPAGTKVTSFAKRPVPGVKA